MVAVDNIPLRYWLDRNYKTRKNNVNTILTSPIFGDNIGIWELELEDRETYILDTYNLETKEGTKGTYEKNPEGFIRVVKWNIPIQRPLDFDLFEEYWRSLPEYADESIVKKSRPWTNFVKAKKFVYCCKNCRFMQVLSYEFIMNAANNQSRRHTEFCCRRCSTDYSYKAITEELAPYGLSMLSTEEEFYCYINNKRSPSRAQFTVTYDDCTCVLEKDEEEKRCKIENFTLTQIRDYLKSKYLDRRDPSTGTYKCPKGSNAYRYTQQEIGAIGEHAALSEIIRFFERLGIHVVCMYSGEGGQADLIFSIPHKPGLKIYDLFYVRIQLKTILYRLSFGLKKEYYDDVIMMFLHYQHKGLGSDDMDLNSVSMNTWQRIKQFAKDRSTKKSKEGRGGVRPDILHEKYGVPMELVGAALYYMYIDSDTLSYWEARSPRKCNNTGILEAECYRHSVEMASEFYVYHHNSLNYRKWDNGTNMLIKYHEGFDFNSDKYDVINEKVMIYDEETQRDIRYVWIRHNDQSKSYTKCKRNLLRCMEGLPKIYSDDDGIHSFHLYDRVDKNIFMVPWADMLDYLNKPNVTHFDFADFYQMILDYDNLLERFPHYRYGWDEPIPLNLLERLTGIDQKHFGTIDINDIVPVEYSPIEEFEPKIEAERQRYKQERAEKVIADMNFGLM